jgi:L-fuculose-phosphate aldolase
MVGEAAKNHDALLMDRHGAVCMGSTLLEAFCRLETMEHTALITKLARDMGQVKKLPPEEAEHLRKMGLKRYGGPPTAMATLDQPGADLPESCLKCSDIHEPTVPLSDNQKHLQEVLAKAQVGKNSGKDLRQMITEELINALKE